MQHVNISLPLAVDGLHLAGSGARLNDDLRPRDLSRDGVFSSQFWSWRVFYTLGRPLSRDVMFLFSFGSSAYPLDSSKAAVSAQQPVEHVKDALQNITTERTPQSVDLTFTYIIIGVDPLCL